MESSSDARKLYMCFDADGGEGMAYFTYAVEIAALTSQMKELPPLEKLASVEGDKTCAFMGCGALGSLILLAGGLRRNQNPYKPFQRYSFTDLNDVVLAFDTQDASSGQPSFVPYTRMLSGKAEPFMAEINGKLYVLNSSRSIHECAKTFEVFDPKLIQWTALSDPSFIAGSHPVRPGFAEFSYLTLTSYKEIFLSSSAFDVLRYDIDDDIWYSDMTFGRLLLPFMDKSGVSFNFGDEDVCICFEDGFLTAYLVKKIWSFKTVTKVQKLGLIASEDSACCCFAKLEGQKMCLVTNTEDPDLDGNDVVVATCEFDVVVDDTNGCDFTLEEREAIMRSEFLERDFVDFRILSKYSYPRDRFATGSYDLWKAIGCFVL